MESTQGSASLLRLYRWQLIVATWWSYAGFYVTRKVFNIAKGPMKEVLLLDDVRIGKIYVVYLVGYALGQFVSAGLSRRMRHRTQLLLGMGVSIACNVAMGLLVTRGPAAYHPIMLIMGIHGVAQATGWPCNIGLLANWTHHSERGRLVAIWGTCYQLGSVVAKHLASFLLGWLGLSWSFYGSCVVLAAVWLMFWFWGRERPESHGLAPVEVEASPSTTTSTSTAPVLDGARLMRLMISMGIIYFTFKFLRYALDSWSALIINEHFHLKAHHAGHLSTTFDWLGFLGVIAAGFLSDYVFKTRRAAVIFLMTAGTFVATFAMWRIGLTSVTAFAVLLGLIGFMMMGPDSLLSGAGAIDIGGREKAALAAGIINGLGSIGPIAQEYAIPLLKKHYGIEAVFLLLVGMTFLAVVGTGLLWHVVRKNNLPL
jgi:OPA family glycerol-3-phosphate transporter-like MFS transporter